MVVFCVIVAILLLTGCCSKKDKPTEKKSQAEHGTSASEGSVYIPPNAEGGSGATGGNCTDGRKNQNEQGVDCGGVCQACSIYPTDGDNGDDSKTIA